jgi:tetratricopeptide (TPR) repeat protein
VRSAENRPPRIWTSWLRLAGLTVVEFAWTAKVVVGLLVLFNIAIIYDPRSPTGLKFVLPALTWVLVLIIRRFTVPPRHEPGVPDGLAMTRADAPSLWSLVGEARTAIHGPRVARMLVGHGTEVALWPERRRWRMRSRRVLTVGFGAVAACSPAELEAMVALVSAHGRRMRIAHTFVRGGEIYTRRREVAERGGARCFLSRPFYRWFAPRYDAELGRLASARILAADQAAARATSPQALTSALVKHRAVQAFLDEEFWPSIWSRIRIQTSPPQNVHDLMAESLRSLDAHPAFLRWLTDGLDAENPFAPSIRRRLQSLGASDELLGPEAILDRTGPGIPADEFAYLTRRLSERWSELVDEEWALHRGEHEFALANFERLAEADSEAALDEDSLGSYAALIERFQGSAAALEHYERAAAVKPSDPVAQFHLGRLLLAAGDMRGLECLERAIALDHEALVPACGVAERYLRERGKPVEADSYVARRAEYLERRDEAERLAASLDKDVPLEPHGLDPVEVAAIRDRAAQLRDVDAIFLARRALSGFPGESRYIAMTLRKRPTFGLERRDADSRLAAAVHSTVPFPDGTVVYATTVDGDPVWVRFRSILGAEVYRRNWRSTVKWGKVLTISGVSAFFASAWTGEAFNNPAFSAAVFFLVLGGGTVGLYFHETNRPTAR